MKLIISFRELRRIKLNNSIENAAPILIVLIITSFTVAGNLLLKLGMSESSETSVWPMTLINKYSVLGLISFGLAFVGYATVLQKIPLNLAQAMFSFQFIAVIISSSLILGEPIGAVRWLGMAIILVGILIVSFASTIEP